MNRTSSVGSPFLISLPSHPLCRSPFLYILSYDSLHPHYSLTHSNKPNQKLQPSIYLPFLSLTSSESSTSSFPPLPSSPLAMPPSSTTSSALLAHAHSSSYHSTVHVSSTTRQALLDWFDSRRDERGMPWRKRFDKNRTKEERGQRAYEVSTVVVDGLEGGRFGWLGGGREKRDKGRGEGKKALSSSSSSSLPSSPFFLMRPSKNPQLTSPLFMPPIPKGHDS